MHQRTISAVNRMLHITLRGCWCDITVLSAHAPTEDKSDYTKDSFYGDLERVLDSFPNYHMEILVKIFQFKSRERRYFKTAIGNESLREISNDNGVSGVYFARATSKI
jgi:hypothetical protein